MEISNTEKYLIYDVETTGLPVKRASPVEYHKYPYIVQIAWSFDNTEKSYIIKPDNYLINPESTKIHGITTEFALKNGTPILEVLREFEKDCKNIEMIICHNYEFDRNVLLANCYRYNFPRKEFLKQGFCTMKYMTDICKLPGLYGYKYPKLVELYEFLFNTKPECRMHNAMNDVRITRRCFDEIIKKYIYKELQ